MLKKDALLLGIIIGIVFPMICFILLYSTIIGATYFFSIKQIIRTSTLVLLSLVPNLITLRYYLVKLKFEKTGRGIMLVTFIFAILFFILIDKINT